MRDSHSEPRRLVLNVGGGSRDLPPRYAGWDQQLLDINADCKPDLLMDALELSGHDELYRMFDAVHCSHNLEHFYAHDADELLCGFRSVLADTGFVHIIVPNIAQVFRDMMGRQLDLDDVWYRANSAPITFHDVLYGWNVAMSNGNLFYAHKSGYTPGSLRRTLSKVFPFVEVFDQGANIVAFAYKQSGVRQCP